MRLKRNNRNLLIEPPTVATGDIAFNLIVFFLVCTSSAPNSGRQQNIPRSESKEQKAQQSENIEVSLTRTTVSINGGPVRQQDFLARMRQMLSTKTRPEDKIVTVKSSKDTPYAHWIYVTGLVEEAGGVVTLQLEETQEQVVE